jgi:hypothetical protein
VLPKEAIPVRKMVGRFKHEGESVECFSWNFAIFCESCSRSHHLHLVKGLGVGGLMGHLRRCSLAPVLHGQPCCRLELIVYWLVSSLQLRWGA